MRPVVPREGVFMSRVRRSIVIVFACLGTWASLAAGQSKITVSDTGVCEINGKKTFTIGFTLPPQPDAKAYNGKPALEEFRDAGAVFIRTGPMLDTGGEWSGDWDAKWIARETQYQAAAAKA